LAQGVAKAVLTRCGMDASTPDKPSIVLVDDDPAVRAARARALSALADERLRRYAASFAGREADVLVETAHPPAGWTGEHLRCRIEGGPDARIARRARVRVRITGSDGTGLTGTLL
jgi:tRNA A37 methylthiotransferase MiaB